MAIRGWMTYLRNHPNLLHSYELHDEYLVVDGLGLAGKLSECPRGSTVLGSDYAAYARRVTVFFDDLKKCNVTPLVLLDGGHGVIDLQEHISKKQLMLESVICHTPADKNKSKILPLTRMRVFRSILIQRGVKIVRCFTETKLECKVYCAGVAIALDCPVLTCSSKFFMYGAKCISIDTLCETKLGNSWRRNCWRKGCSLFDPRNLSKAFPGFLTRSGLPLASILLRSTVEGKNIFDEFFARLMNSKIWPSRSGRLYSDEQQKIEATLRWLSHNKLDDAIAKIIETLPEDTHEKVLNKIEKVINDHCNLPFEMLKTLGLEKEYETATNVRNQGKKSELPCDFDKMTLKNDKNTCRQNALFVRSESLNTEQEKEEETKQVYNHLGESNEEIMASLPPWFVPCFDSAKFPTYFADLLLHRFFDVPMRPENPDYPSPMESSIKILRVIDGLLVAGREESSSTDLMYLIRKGMTIETRCIETLRSIESTRFPALEKLADTPMEVKKRIIDDTLGISGLESHFDDVPANWRLYIATIVFWMLQMGIEPRPDACHVRAVLFTMLFGVVDKKIGYQRSLKNLENILARHFVATLAKRCTEEDTVEDKRQASIHDALKNVTEEDCLSAAPIFIANHHVNPRLETGSSFNVMIVHVFMQFQSCLRHTIDLNELLGCPYDSPAIEELYNGTMLYNLYDKFAKDRHVDDCITPILAPAPSLQNLFNRLIDKVEMIIDARTRV